MLSLLLLPPFLLAATPLQGDGVPVDPLAAGLEAWEGDKRFWSLEDGVLMGRSTDEIPCDETTYLTWTGGEVADFVLQMEFKIEGGNSGVQFRSERAQGYDLTGYQADIEAGPIATGSLYETGRRAILGPRGMRVILDPDGSRRYEPLSQEAVEIGRNVAGEWHEYRIRAVGDRIEIALDGVITSDVLDRDLAHLRRTGCVGFQLHKGAPMSVSFRNVRILHLDAEKRLEKLADSEFTLPHWIWLPGEPSADQQIWTRTVFEVDSLQAGAKAVLTGSGDNAVKVFINGTPVVDWEEWWTPFRIDVTEHLHAGTNTLEAWGWNESGPAALWLEVDLETADGTHDRWFSQETWPVTDRQPPNWPDAGPERGPVEPVRWRIARDYGALGVDPWGSQLGFLDNRLAGVLPANELVLAEGFKAERIYSVPLLRQGSWVALTLDDAGRIYTSSQHRDMFRLTVPPLGSEGPVHTEKLDVGIGNAQGLCFAFDSLYAVVAEGKHTGLWRLRDLDGDDIFEDVSLLKTFDGSGEHGPHGVVLGPDGKSLYVIGGNHTALPEGISRFRPAPIWREDQLLPRRPDPKGHAVGIYAPGGWLCRTNPDGSEWELVAIGMRNAYDVAFNVEGEPFTFDSDMEWDVGLPWYRAPRILHLASGAEFGWRNGSGKWPEHYPDSLPGAADSTLASPTGLIFGYDTGFHAPWRSALFVADWAYGTIQAVHLEPNGSTFTGSFTPFISGRPFPVTDMAVGNDGALYVVTGGRRTHSAIYRIWSTERNDENATAPSAPPDPDGLRATRRAVEARHGLPDPPIPWKELGHTDRFLAYAARVTLEHIDPKRWSEDALAEADLATALHALLALVRVDGSTYGQQIHGRLAQLPWDALPPEELLPWLRLIGLADIRAGAPPTSLLPALLKRLENLFPSGERLLDRELSRLLAHYDSPKLAREAVNLLETSPRTDDQIHLAMVLSFAETGWTFPLRRRYFQWLDRVATIEWGAGASFDLYIDGIREDAVDRLPLELAQHPDLLIPALDLASASQSSAEPARFVRHWTLEVLAPELSRVTAGRDFDSGRRAFQTAACLECHRIAGQGGATGPDLTGAGARFTQRDLLDAILTPSAEVSDQYRETMVRTIDGAIYVGRLEAEDELGITIRPSAPNSESIFLKTEEVDLRMPSRLSRMPTELLDCLDLQAVLDLLAYVLAGGQADDPAFRR